MLLRVAQEQIIRVMRQRFLEIHSQQLLIAAEYPQLHDGIGSTGHHVPAHTRRLNARPQRTCMLIVPAKSDEGYRHAQLGEIHRYIARPARAVLEPGDIDYRYRRLGTDSPTGTAPEAIEHDVSDNGDVSLSHIRERRHRGLITMNNSFSARQFCESGHTIGPRGH